jgi:uncharacterized membrane protein
MVENHLTLTRQELFMTSAITIGAIAGVALGIIVGLTTGVPLAPELGLVLGGVVGWLSRRDRG